MSLAEDGESGRPGHGRGRLLAFALFFLLPLALRAIPIGHGLPHGYVPDAHIVRNALGMARDKNPVPAVGEYSTYPNLLPYMLIPLYGAYYFWGSATGAWEGAEEFGDHILAHPEEPHLIARWLVVVLGALTPWVVFRAARAAGLQRGAWVAGWLVTTGLLHMHLSVHERPWIPMTLFMALTAWMGANYVTQLRTKWLVLCGAAAGLAFATHQAGLGALGIAGFVWLFAPGGWTGADLGRRVVRGFLCVAVFGVVGLVLGHPYWLVHGFTPEGAVVGGEAVEATGALSIGGMSFLPRFDSGILAKVSKGLVGYDPVIVLLALFGLVPALKRRASRPAVVWTLVWTGIFFCYHAAHMRYLVPTTVLLAVPAGFAAESVLRRSWGKLALAPLLLAPLVQTVRLDWLLLREDTRFEGEELLYQLPLGAYTAKDRYGPDVKLTLGALEELQKIRELQGAGLTSRERARKRTLSLPGGAAYQEIEKGVNVLPVEDLLVYDEFAWTVDVREDLRALGAEPAALIDALGVTHVMLVERRFGGRENRIAPIVFGLTPIHEIDPGHGSAREALLPTEMDFPLTGLWTVTRPGPRLRIYALP